jgi:hypothetical protein
MAKISYLNYKHTTRDIEIKTGLKPAFIRKFVRSNPIRVLFIGEVLKTANNRIVFTDLALNLLYRVSHYKKIGLTIPAITKAIAGDIAEPLHDYLINNPDY